MQQTDLLDLVRVPIRQGVLYLYPEYVDQAERFERSEYRQDFKASRPVTLRDSYCGQPYVIKAERDTNDHYRRKYPWLVPKDGNIAIKEVSIARALSQLASFNDGSVAVEFEQPCGLFFDNGGMNWGLYEYKAEIHSEKVLPPDLARLEEALEQERLQRISQVGAKSFEEGEINEKNWLLRLFVQEFYFPRDFSNIVLLYNGIEHNEFSYKFGKCIDSHQVPTSFVGDFEFVGYVKEEERNSKMRRAVSYLFGHRARENFSVPENILRVLPADQQAELFAIIENKAREMAQRVVTYLGIDTTTIGDTFHVASNGPAYDLVQTIRHTEDFTRFLRE
ncbi:hypothetical protein HYV86_07160 [Candidatus Woesearchaeota archaeon]|nr:hypothetical protein [Candidatus Woesearchaeota archaeon]